MKHDVDSENCPCNPEVLQPCLECWDLKIPNPDCWACGGRGLVPVYDESKSRVIVHREDGTTFKTLPPWTWDDYWTSRKHDQHG